MRKGPDYPSRKEKAASGKALFDLVGSDLWACSTKQEHIAEKCTLPK